MLAPSLQIGDLLMDEVSLFLVVVLAVLVVGWFGYGASRRAAASQTREQAAAEAQRVAAEESARRRARKAAAAEQAALEAAAQAARADATRVAAAQAARAEAARTAAAEAAHLHAAQQAESAAADARLARAEAVRLAAENLARAQAVQRAAAEDARARVAEEVRTRAAEDARANADAEAALRAAAHRRAAAPTAVPPPSPTAAPKSPEQTLVLVADDSKVVRVKTGRLLALHHYRVAYATDGMDAAQQMQTDTPDIVITDVEMPGMDGFELTRHVRQNPLTAHIPVIMITSADDRHRGDADRAGVSVLLGKPYPEDELIDHIRLAMRRRETPASAAAV